MLESIRLVNFKSHTNTTITPGRLTVLVGPNGVGKSSVLQGPRLIKGALISGDHHLQGPNTPANFIPPGKRQAQILIAFSGTHPSQRTASMVLSTQNSSWNEQSTHANTAIKSSVFLKLNAERLAAPSPQLLEPKIDHDGFGLATVINHLRASEPDRFDAIEQSVKDIIPFIKRIRTRPAAMEGGQIGHELLFDTSGGKGITGHCMSEGTLFMLGLLTAIFCEEKPGLVLLDDLQQALHPRAQRDLIAKLRDILDRFPELQIIASTHSPYLVDGLEPEEVWVMALDQSGQTITKRLSEHPEAEQMLEALTTGEFWSAVGEDWVLENAG